MAFKETPPEFKLIDVTLIDPDPEAPRKHGDETGLKGLVNAIKAKGLIQPLVVQPADSAGRYRLIVGERRWRAAVLAGETQVPALVRPCDPQETLEIQVFENLGLGVRAPLEPRDMANAIQTIAERFESKEAAAEHFGRTPTWLNQATAAANLSPKVTALLDSGKISSTSTAIQLEKLAQKNEAKVDTLIEQIQEGEKLPKQVVESALSAEGIRRSKKVPAPEAPPAPAPVLAAPVAGDDDLPPWEEAPAAAPQAAAPARERRVNPNKMKMVAEILGLADGDEEEVLARLIDEFLA
ncbi:MAG TPA: ParB/RepB/Spo0J family partition protein, partial [Azospira sp.]|nr:ParB/RepB/Spo0J family partition protein [Azospira sp.]